MKTRRATTKWLDLIFTTGEQAEEIVTAALNTEPTSARMTFDVSASTGPGPEPSRCSWSVPVWRLWTEVDINLPTPPLNPLKMTHDSHSRERICRYL